MASSYLLYHKLLAAAAENHKATTQLIRPNKIADRKCRVCGEKPGSIRLFNNELRTNIVGEIYSITGVLFRNMQDLSTYICLSCVDQLDSSIQFRNMCRRSNEIIVEANVKEVLSEKKCDNGNTLQMAKKNIVHSQSINKEEDMFEEDKSKFKSAMDMFKEDKSKFKSAKDMFKEDKSKFKSAKKNITTKKVDKKDDNNFSDSDEYIIHTSQPITSPLLGHRSPSNEGRVLDLVHHTDEYDCDYIHDDENFNDDEDKNQYIYDKNDECLVPQSLALPNLQTILQTKKKKRKQPVPHLCDTCGKIYNSSSELRFHMLIHKNVFPFACDKCPYKGRTKTALVIHMKSHLPYSERPFSCPHCGIKTSSPSNMNKHIRSVHNKVEREFKCAGCEKGFKSKRCLKRHVMDIHDNTSTTKCQICCRVMRKSHLKTHLLRIHNIQKVKSNLPNRLPAYILCKLTEEDPPAPVATQQ